MKPLIQLILVAACSASSLFAQKEPRKVNQTQAMGAVTTRVQPEYPAIARQLKLGGAVDVEVVITEEGVPEDVRIVSGNPVLTKPCVDAVKKWRFKPFLEGGKAVKAVAALTFTFQKP